jgi:hypothetical protein
MKKTIKLLLALTLCGLLTTGFGGHGHGGPGGGGCAGPRHYHR